MMNSLCTCVEIPPGVAITESYVPAPVPPAPVCKTDLTGGRPSVLRHDLWCSCKREGGNHPEWLAIGSYKRRLGFNPSNIVGSNSILACQILSKNESTERISRIAVFVSYAFSVCSMVSTVSGGEHPRGMVLDHTYVGFTVTASMGRETHFSVPKNE
jgi:hypothetical protein